MSFLSTRVHFIWSTAQREPQIDPAWQQQLYAFIVGLYEHRKSKVFAIGGVSDHLHIYASLPATLSIAELANAIKSNSSGWVHDEYTRVFGWQKGYAAFTMSKSADDDVCAYIRGQAEHHRKRTFKEELLAFLGKYEVPYDPRYVFE